MHDEPQRECAVLDSGRRGAEPLEHVETRARSPSLGFPPSKVVEDARSARYEDCQDSREENFRSTGTTSASAKTTERRMPVGIGLCGDEFRPDFRANR